MLKTTPQAPRWMTISLRLAGIYNLLWGAWAVLFPNAYFEWLGLAPPNYPGLWQCIGMIVGVYGIGYWIAGNDPYRHWPIVLVGWLGKVLGPIGLVFAVNSGELPWSFGLVNLSNDLIWWIPFTLILYKTWFGDRWSGQPLPTLAEALEQYRSQDGTTLGALSRRSPVLVVFLRHLG